VAQSAHVHAVLGHDDDVGAVPGRPLGNRQADAARGAGDEQGFALERRVAGVLRVSICYFFSS
jgi:hypothetical protein